MQRTVCFTTRRHLSSPVANLLGLCLGLGPLEGVLHAQADPPHDLRLGDRLERRIGAAEDQIYAISLTAGDFLHLVVNQVSSDTWVILLSPAGDTLLDRDSPEQDGPEPLSHVASVSGVHSIVVRAASAGLYRITIEALRPALESDRRFAAAERLYDAATEMPGTYDSLPGVIAAYDSATRIWRELGAREWVAWVQLFEADAMLSHDELDRAKRVLEGSLGLARDLRDSVSEMRALTKLGVLWYRAGNLDSMIAYSEAALLLAERLGDLRRQATLLSNIGLTRGNRGETEAATRSIERAIEVDRWIGNDAALASALNNLAILQMDVGRYEASVEALQEALRLNRARGDTSNAAINLNNIAQAYSYVGRNREALEHLYQALALHEKTGDRRSQATTLTNIANVEADSTPAKARELYLRALALRRETGDIAGEAATLHNLGNLCNVLRDFRCALEHLTRARELEAQLGERGHEAMTLGLLGKVYFRTGDTTRSLASYRESLALSRQAGDRRSEAVTLSLIAQVLRESGHLDSARRESEASLEVWESIRRQMVAAGGRSSFFAQFESGYQFLVDVLMRQHGANPARGFDKAALDVAEHARARGLLDALAAVRDGARAGLDSSLANREREVQSRIAAASRRRTGTSAERQRELDSLLAAYDEVEGAIRRAHPHYAELADPRPLTGQAIQKDVLDGGTVLLTYALGDEKSYFWAVTRDSIASYELPKRADIEPVIRGFYDQVTARNRRTKGETTAQWRARIAVADRGARQNVVALSRLLLAPAAGLLKGKRVVISSSGSIEWVPFAALVDPDSLDRSGSTPLIAAHEVVHLPSASSAALLRQRQRGNVEGPKLLALVADPVFSATDPRLGRHRTARVGGQPSDTTAQSGDLFRAVTLAGALNHEGELPRLPFARAEADAILGLVPPEQRSVALGVDANLPFVLAAEFARHRILHFATHALLNDEQPELSGIALSLVDSLGGPRDGFLRLQQLYALDLPAELVVLSACQTAMGKEIRGEGLVSLARGFMQAGAARVVGSLWKVDDQATSELMRRFYEALLGPGHLPPAAALRMAQLRLSKVPRWSAPFYWSGFTLQGEWR